MPHSVRLPAAQGASPEASEASLVARARQDPDAFAALYRLHHPAIARYVGRRIGDGDAAGDLVAETFLTALEKLSGYRERGAPFRAWLYRLASTRVNRWLRSHGRRLRSLEEEPAQRDDISATEEGAAGLARAALLALPLRYQTTLALHYLEGLSVAEVATAMGCRAGTVKARLSRGRERMRRALEARAEELFS